MSKAPRSSESCLVFWVVPFFTESILLRFKLTPSAEVMWHKCFTSETKNRKEHFLQIVCFLNIQPNTIILSRYTRQVFHVSTYRFRSITLSEVADMLQNSNDLEFVVLLSEQYFYCTLQVQTRKPWSSRKPWAVCRSYCWCKVAGKSFFVIFNL